MSLQYELFTISNSLAPIEERKKMHSSHKKSEAYKELCETDKLVYELFVKDCYSAAADGEKFIDVPERTSSEVLKALGIPANAAFFYWDSPTSI